jgi:hypothetical protein
MQLKLLLVKYKKTIRNLFPKKPIKGYDRTFGTKAYLLLSLLVDNSKIKVLARRRQLPRIPQIPQTQTQTPNPLNQYRTTRP